MTFSTIDTYCFCEYLSTLSLGLFVFHVKFRIPREERNMEYIAIDFMK